ncbi:hypothetical protein NHX12_002696 [Muraenolepis orangiensis]|uniref:Transmembrane protein n=1 Tax=Muraenolepis orangiensis TaxID=630683 RepID=A0A9Q0DX61_9TELE|nr:hypothetical protein NHX12_002696 [Muraenolepis orangiensis]
MATTPEECEDEKKGSQPAPDRNGYTHTCAEPPRSSKVRLSSRGLWWWWCGGGAAVVVVVCVGALAVVLALLVNCADRRSEVSVSGSRRRAASPAQLVSDCAAELLQSCWSAVVSPALSLTCAFFWVGVYSIRRGVPARTALFILTVWHLGETATRSLFSPPPPPPGTTDEPRLFSSSSSSSTTAAAVVLACLAAGALMVARLNQGISVVVCIGVVKTVSLLSLHKVRAAWRPYVAYLVGVLGILLARYADRLLQKHPGIHQEGWTDVTGARGREIPAFKRRRRSSSSVILSDMAHSQPSSKSHRRTSLPCIQRDQSLGTRLFPVMRLEPREGSLFSLTGTRAQICIQIDEPPVGL